VKVVIGGDHAGFHLKQELVGFLRQAGHDVEDVGSHDPNPVDFPDVAKALCARVRDGRAVRGLMVCGTGVGAVIATNKIRGIRSAVCHDVHSAHQAVEHDDVNVMCVGAQIVGPWLARDLVAAFLDARFDASEDSTRRVQKLHAMENEG
jgi:ribose 5-phosphate isomerase B